MSRFVSSLVLGLACIGCGDPLDLGQIIERTRPLGMRVRVGADPGRAWPRPGESATVEWLVVSPDGPPSLAWTLSTCVAEETFEGPPVCAKAPFAVTRTARFEAVTPLFSFTVPADLQGTERVAMSGAFCEGPPGTDASDPCTEDSPNALAVSADIFLASDDTINRNPDLGDDRIEIGGRLWAEAASPGAPCDDPMAMRVLGSGGERRIRIVFGSDDRDELGPGEDPFGNPRETLVVSHFSTGGELERQFSVIEPSDETPTPSVAVEWKPPKKVPSNGTPVTFFFVVRDGRGGTDWTQRELCTLP